MLLGVLMIFLMKGSIYVALYTLYFLVNFYPAQTFHEIFFKYFSLNL